MELLTPSSRSAFASCGTRAAGKLDGPHLQRGSSAQFTTIIAFPPARAIVSVCRKRQDQRLTGTQNEYYAMRRRRRRHYATRVRDPLSNTGRSERRDLAHACNRVNVIARTRIACMHRCGEQYSRMVRSSADRAPFAQTNIARREGPSCRLFPTGQPARHATCIQQATRRGNRSVRQSATVRTTLRRAPVQHARTRRIRTNERLRRQAPCTAVSVRPNPARLSRAPARARSQALRPNPKPAESGRRCGSGESSPGADVAGVSPVPCACRRGSEGARPTDTYVSERMHTLKTT